MFVPLEYQDYKYLVECHDNYVILSKKSHISGSSGDPDSVTSLYQYLIPSGLSVVSTYRSEQSFNFTDVSSSFTDNFYERADCPIILLAGFIFVLIFTFVLNQCSKLVQKGGLFGSN